MGNKHLHTCIYKEEKISAHIYFNETHNPKEAPSMSGKVTLSLLTLPVEIVYRILDNLERLEILLSVRNVCTRLNAITDIYHPYQVNFHLHFPMRFSSVAKYRSFQL
jgi:hypothetical protein